MIKIQFTVLPKTRLGASTLMLTGLVILGLLVFFILVSVGYRGGDTFFSKPALVIPILVATVSGMAGFFTGLVSMILYRDFSVLVLISVLIGLFVLIFVLGEAITLIDIIAPL